MSTGIQVVYGGGSLWAGKLHDPAIVEQILSSLLAHGVSTIDTAAIYEGSEEALGAVKAIDRFVIDTKAAAGIRPPATREAIVGDARASEEKLGGGPVDIYYLHRPDDSTPIENTLEGINEVYGQGFFKRFGLSNYSAEEVQKVYDICKAKGYPLPTVYQGRYGPADRQSETELFPTLRSLGIAFYAYSPVAGGLLAKTKEEVLAGKGRFDTSTMLGQAYMSRYGRSEYLDLLDQWAKIAEEEGTTRTELAYRWVRYNSALKPEHGDAVIMGASTLQQTTETLEAVGKGPLSEKALKAIDDFSQAIIQRVGSL